MVTKENASKIMVRKAKRAERGSRLRSGAGNGGKVEEQRGRGAAAKPHRHHLCCGFFPPTCESEKETLQTLKRGEARRQR